MTPVMVKSHPPVVLTPALVTELRQQVLQSADTPEDINIVIEPFEGEEHSAGPMHVGSTYGGPASVPRTLPIPSASGPP